MIRIKGLACGVLATVLAAAATTLTVLPADAAAADLPPGYTVGGTDVSHYAGTVDWSQAAANGVKFGWAKAAEGVDYVDETFDANYRDAKANGVIRSPF